MESLTNQVQASFRDIVLRSEWLSNSTKELAQNKIDNIVHSIGYPDAIVDEDEVNMEIEGVRAHHLGTLLFNLC